MQEQGKHDWSRRRFLQAASAVVATSGLAACTSPATQQALMGQTPTLPDEAPGPVSADEALQLLVAGNTRYVTGATLPINESAERRTIVAGGQAPFATIFSCVDSRVPPELVFDRGLGDLFVIRTAGQVVDNAVLGSLIFGSDELQIPLLVVMGHSKCGAVTAAIELLEAGTEVEGPLGFIVDSLTQVVEETAGMGEDHLDIAVHANVEHTVEMLRELPEFQHAQEAGMRIVGAVYDLESGVVEFTVL